MKRSVLVKLICILILIVGFFAVVLDLVVTLGGSEGMQYMLNIAYIAACPALIGGIGYEFKDEK